MGQREDARKIKALADENRLKIVLSLQNGEKCACVLGEELNISQSTLSHHMRLLCDSNLVNGRKDGKWMYYSLSPEGTDSLLGMLSEYLKCNGKNDKSSCCK